MNLLNLRIEWNDVWQLFVCSDDNYDGAPDADAVNQLIGTGRTQLGAVEDYFEYRVPVTDS